MYLNFSAFGKLFPHVFHYFKPHTVKTALGKTVLDKGLLLLEMPG